MQMGMIGPGRMGANMTRRLLGQGHGCVVYDAAPAALKALQDAGAIPVTSIADLVKTLAAPRVVWLMLPTAVVEPAL